MQVKTLLDVALTDTEQTETLTGKRWYIEHIIISKITSSTGNITLKFADNEHFSSYSLDEEEPQVFSMPFPYVLEDGESFAYEADANNKFRVALIGTEEVI